MNVNPIQILKLKTAISGDLAGVKVASLKLNALFIYDSGANCAIYIPKSTVFPSMRNNIVKWWGTVALAGSP